MSGLNAENPDKPFSSVEDFSPLPSSTPFDFKVNDYSGDAMGFWSYNVHVKAEVDCQFC